MRQATPISLWGLGLVVESTIRQLLVAWQCPVLVSRKDLQVRGKEGGWEGEGGK